jgi:Tfp pilus assembly protein PilV
VPGVVLRAPEERGESLIEAVITLGLLASILLSSLGLFTLGERRLRSARAASQALALARSILEETEAWSVAEFPDRLAVDGSAASSTIDTRTSPAAAAWHEAIASAIPGAFATVRVDALPFDGPAEPLRDAKGLRVVVAVQWDEAGVQREVRLGTARF